MLENKTIQTFRATPRRGTEREDRKGGGERERLDDDS